MMLRLKRSTDDLMFKKTKNRRAIPGIFFIPSHHTSDEEVEVTFSRQDLSETDAKLKT
jgi:hypothetical protein